MKTQILQLVKINNSDIYDNIIPKKIQNPKSEKKEWE